MTKKILVIGSGVSGLTTAFKLLRSGHEVTIWSKEGPGQFPTTSANAYAMWVPVKIDADARVERWTDESFAEFVALSGDARTGVTLRPIVVLKQGHDEPWYAKKLSIFRHARADELPSGYKDANVLDGAPVIDPSVYLRWLHQEVVNAGGVFETREVKSFDEVEAKFEIIINCAGLGARQLARDTTLFPERVQVLKVKPNSLVDKVIIDDDGPNKRACIVPHADHIRIGGVFDGSIETLEVDHKHTRDILDRCSRLVPGFKPELKDVISVDRALRPERSLTRVELEKLPSGRSVYHNYGHDGMGYLISWGIAEEIAQALK